MLRILDRNQTLCDGISRREWLRIGGIGLGGLTLPTLLSARKAQAATGSGRAFGKAKSVIVLWWGGGPPQHDTWDVKPEAPQEVRGESAAIRSQVPGMDVGWLMPMTATLTDKIAALRAVVTNDNAHSSSGYQMLTGIPHLPLNVENATPKFPNLWPSLGGMLRSLRPGVGQIPSAITLPHRIENVGAIPWPGQDAGFLGHAYDPWILTCDPSAEKFKIPDLAFPDDIPPLRFDHRRSLLEQVNKHLDGLDSNPTVAGYSRQAEQAVSLLSGPKGRAAFDLSRETPAVRERYGSSKFAQSVLLARKLVEAGVSLVHVNWCAFEKEPNSGSWDTHEKHDELLKRLLMPIMDRAYSALLEDLSDRGMLDETLVCWMGEFGHTPKFNSKAGRDHWGQCFSIALAGGGIRGGQLIGKSDAQAAYPISGKVEANDVIATVFHSLGYAPETEMHEATGRPLPISRGKVIEEMF